MECAKCGKVLEKPVCMDCVKEELQATAEILDARILEISKRLESVEGELIRLQQKVMDLR